MVVKVVVGVTVFLVATIGVARGIRAADWALPAVLSAIPLESSNCIQMCQLPCADVGICSLASFRRPEARG